MFKGLFRTKVTSIELDAAIDAELDELEVQALADKKAARQKHTAELNEALDMFSIGTRFEYLGIAFVVVNTTRGDYSVPAYVNCEYRVDNDIREKCFKLFQLTKLQKKGAVNV